MYHVNVYSLYATAFLFSYRLAFENERCAHLFADLVADCQNTIVTLEEAK